MSGGAAVEVSRPEGLIKPGCSVFGERRGGSHRHHNVVNRLADCCGVVRVGEEGLMGGACHDPVHVGARLRRRRSPAVGWSLNQVESPANNAQTACEAEQDHPGEGVGVSRYRSRTPTRNQTRPRTQPPRRRQRAQQPRRSARAESVEALRERRGTSAPSTGRTSMQPMPTQALASSRWTSSTMRRRRVVRRSCRRVGRA